MTTRAGDRLIVRLVDALHETSTIDDALWSALASTFGDGQLLELIMLAGYYRGVSYLVNALRLPPEAFASRFASGGSAAALKRHRPPQ